MNRKEAHGMALKELVLDFLYFQSLCLKFDF